MKKTVLDNYVVLYSNNKTTDFVELIEKIELQESNDPVWYFSAPNNIDDTNHTINQKNIKLSIPDNLFPFISNSVSLKENTFIKKNNLKYALNSYAFLFLYDYINDYELSIKKIKNWDIYEQINDTEFHYDKNRDGRKHSYTIIIALNDGYTGGEIVFENRIGNEHISMSKGDVLIYPSNAQYMHKELKVTSGKKYMAISHF
jgi:hypothetical protein